MDTSNNSGNSQHKKCVRQRIRQDGKIIYSTSNTGNGDCLPKTPYNERKPKLPKGSVGLSRKQKEEIDLAFHQLKSELGLNNCKYMVLTFDENASDEALNNLIDNFDALNKAVKYRFEQVAYKNLKLKPYVLVWGLRECTSYARNILCFDLNILCAVKDKDGKPLFNETEIIKQIYLSVSKYAKEVIKPPLDFYSSIPLDYIKLANYFKKQVESKLLHFFSNSSYADKLPNTYSYVPKSLSEAFESLVTNFENSAITEHKELLAQEFSDKVTLESDKINDDYKFVAQLKQDELIDEFQKEYERAYHQKHSFGFDK